MIENVIESVGFEISNMNVGVYALLIIALWQAPALLFVSSFTAIHKPVIPLRPKNGALLWKSRDKCVFATTSTMQSTLLAASQPSPNKDDSENAVVDYSKEETLLCLDLVVNPGVDVDAAVAKVSKFCQSFPFAAVLPVQPLHYVPVYEDGGVEVKFLRKKTTEKSSIDGGIRFFVTCLPAQSEKDVEPAAADLPFVDAEEDDDDDNDGAMERNDVDATTFSVSPSRSVIQITAKRNSRGQTIAKLFAEKLVITSFVASISGTATSAFGTTAPLDHVQVQSLYHKWM
jgi:hypothetical protein